MGLVAVMTLQNVFGVCASPLLEKASFTWRRPGRPNLLGAFGLAPGPAWPSPPWPWAAASPAFALGKREFRSFDNLLGGFGVGLAVVAAWYVSGHIGYLPEDPETPGAFIATNQRAPRIASFVAPRPGPEL